MEGILVETIWLSPGSIFSAQFHHDNDYVRKWHDHIWYVPLWDDMGIIREHSFGLILLW